MEGRVRAALAATTSGGKPGKPGSAGEFQMAPKHTKSIVFFRTMTPPKPRKDKKFQENIRNAKKREDNV